MLNYSWKASPNRWDRQEFNASFSIGFWDGLSQSSSHSHRGRVPDASRNWLASVKKAHFVAGEFGRATLRIYGSAVGPRGRTSRVMSPNWTPS